MADGCRNMPREATRDAHDRVDVPPADAPAMAGPAVYMKQHRLGESHGNSGEVASLNAEDRADGYHKLRRTEVPAYAVVLETWKLGGSKCKAKCNQGDRVAAQRRRSGGTLISRTLGL